jgi:hypothetical protein
VNAVILNKEFAAEMEKMFAVDLANEPEREPVGRGIRVVRFVHE